METYVRTWSTTVLASALIVAGLLSALHLQSGLSADDAYRTGTLLLGGVMVLVGQLARRRHAAAGTAVLIVGAVAGIMVALQTVVLPLLIVLVVVLTLRDQTRRRPSHA